MKKAASILNTIFATLTLIGCITSAILYFVFFFSSGYEINFVLALFYLGWAILCGVFGTITTNSIKKNKKAVWIGVCDIIFCGVVGGIFYLIWNPNSEDPTAAVAKNEESSRIIENKINANEAPAPKENAAEELLKLKDLKDMGAITDEEYQEKRKNLIDKL